MNERMIESMSHARRVVAAAHKRKVVDVYRRRGSIHISVGTKVLPPLQASKVTESELLSFVSEQLA